MSDVREHEACAELIPAYALGAADNEERRAVEKHLASCRTCCDLLASYQGIEHALAFAVAPASAPFRLTHDLHRRIGQAGSAVPHRSLLRRPALIFGLATLVLLLLTNVYWANRVGRIERETSVLAAIVEAPGIPLTGDAGLPDSRGVFYLPTDATHGLLCVYDLPALPAEQTYQAWLIREGRRVSAGLFRVNAEGYGVLLIRGGEPLQAFDALAITIEPAGGSPAPTTPHVMGGEL